MKIEKFHIYLVDLNPQRGTEPGKVRPVVVVQTNLLNTVHPSTIICPITTNILPATEILRIHVKSRSSGLDKPSDILVDQIRAIDNRRFIEHLGTLTQSEAQQLLNGLQIVIFD